MIETTMNQLNLVPTMNTTPNSVSPSIKTAFKFFKMTVQAQLKTFKTQKTKTITTQHINLLCTYLWRNGNVKNINLIKDMIDEYKLKPLTSLEITQIKKIFSQIHQHHKQQTHTTTINTIQHFIPHILTLTEMSKLNIKVDQYVNLTNYKHIMVGSQVQAPYRNGKKLYKGVIVSIDNKQKTCHIDFDDGDIDTKVILKKVRLLASQNEPNIIKITNIDSTKITCKIESSGQQITLLNDGYIMSKIVPFRVCFQDDNKSMIDMDPELSHKITMSWMNTTPTLNYTIRTFNYQLDWSSSSQSKDIVGRGIQTNIETQKKRDIILFKWKPPKDIFEEFDIVKKEDLPKEFYDVVKTLLKAYPNKEKNMKIYHLEPKLYGDKLLDIACKVQEFKNLSSDTKVLVHGCSEAAIDKIVVHKTGFQNAGTLNGKVYGPGIYLSSDPVYSARDYCPRGKRGTKMMLLCKVLIGGKRETNDSFKMFDSEKFRTGGSTTKGYEHIYMKPFVYVNDVNIAYLVEF